jgi:hypothetical protein
MTAYVEEEVALKRDALETGRRQLDHFAQFGSDGRR